MQNFWAVLVVLPIFTWYSMFTVLDRNYNLAQQDVENIVYRYTQIAAKKGVLYQSVLEEMEKQLSKYGEYEIYISAEKFLGNDEPTVIEGWDAVDVGLRAEGYDLLNVTVQYNKHHPVSILYEYSVFGAQNSKSYNLTLFGKASSYIR
ncbi:MAG: hypothetical protein A2Y23_15485 [Clostridiales bacterium GWB2_37_7]|nr:MAG: hypothetical protein A2Y23_15485 [Clostridiales bacterium GWB2_37_7]